MGGRRPGLAGAELKARAISTSGADWGWEGLGRLIVAEGTTVLPWHRARHWSSHSLPEAGQGLPDSWQGALSECCPAMPAQQSGSIETGAAMAAVTPFSSSAKDTSAQASSRANGDRQGR